MKFENRCHSGASFTGYKCGECGKSLRFVRTKVERLTSKNKKRYGMNFFLVPGDQVVTEGYYESC